MAEPVKTKDLDSREGEATASRKDHSLTLEGAYQKVRATFLKNHPKGDAALLDRAFKAGLALHANQKRRSGEPYFFHPLAVAESLAEWRLDAVSIACGLLHDTVEDTVLTYEGVRREFGE